MFHHSLLIQKIALALKSKLTGSVLVACFTQNKDELILVFNQADFSFCIKADLRPQVSLLSFPESFSRARKNSVDLFSDLLNRKVTDIPTHPLNRSFQIDFGHTSLIFKLYGRRSNILQFDKEELTSVFRSELKQDQVIKRSDFLQNQHLLRTSLNSESRQILKDELSRFIEENNPNQPLENVIRQLMSAPTYTQYQDKPTITLLKSGSENEKEHVDVLEAVNEYHQLFVRNVLFEGEKSKIIQQLTRKKEQTRNYLTKTRRKLDQLTTRRSYKEIADIIMANLHQITPGSKEAELFDFYNNENLTVRLKEKLSPQHNAELLYKKSKNEKLEIEKLEENYKQKESILLELEHQIESLKQIEDWKSLRKATLSETTSSDSKQLPYTSFWFKEFEVRVGKDAKRNDQLTTRYSSKDDLWLHAKDVPGSHVIIRTPTKTKPPKDVIEYAAGLAAFYSKRKSDTLCPVLFTPRKYIRKAKKLAPGMVIVEREEVILVEPLNPNKS